MILLFFFFHAALYMQHENKTDCEEKWLNADQILSVRKHDRNSVRITSTTYTVKPC